MHSAYSEELERKRFMKALQRGFLHAAVFGTLLAVCGVIGWMGIGASFEQLTLSMPEPPKIVR